MNSKGTISRRNFVLQSAMAGSGLLAMPALARCSREPQRIRWTQRDKMIASVACDGMEMYQPSGLLGARIRVVDESPDGGFYLDAQNSGTREDRFRASLTHSLHHSGNINCEDLLEASLTVGNTSDKELPLDISFQTSLQPSSEVQKQRIYIPLSSSALNVDPRFSLLGVKQFLKDGDQAIGRGLFQCHYLEPMASFPDQLETKALLIAPVVDISHGVAEWKVALFTTSDQPVQFATAEGIWRAERQVNIPAGKEITMKCWLLLHQGDASAAWQAFHRFAHKEEYSVPDWIYEFKVHYYDFLSAAEGATGKRGYGFESDLEFFKEFRVGLATQHGYYPAIGDYIHPDRKSWLAMRGDKAGPAEMSVEKMQARIAATRAVGGHPAVYLHAALFDDASEVFSELGDCVAVDNLGQRMNFGWTGPDTAGQTWRASLASPQWCDHLLQQAGWIMEILGPDAIVMDETFAGMGYDFHPDRTGPVSLHAIEFYKKMRSLIKSFGKDKAFFSSDCSMSPFVLWADGECGDHAYGPLLGHELYVQEPVRYLAALGKKPWRPCAWHFTQMWDRQMKFANLLGAGVGVSNGWLEYTGLRNLPEETRTKILTDINSLFH